MATRAIVMAFHKYTPFGDEFYEPILDFQLQQLGKYKDEFDRLYVIDSTWNIDLLKSYDGATEGRVPLVTVLQVNPSLRYYDAYKKVLPQIKEDLILFMDNDMIVYKEGVIDDTFFLLEDHIHDPVVSIYDSIGTYQPPENSNMNGKNKFCPYWFATRKELLMKYLDVDWGPDMPYCETLGRLTEAMLKDEVSNMEKQEDKSNILFDGTKDPEKGKNLGYYHIRAGSTAAYLLATKKYGDRKTYDDYLKNQPKSEILRHMAWYWYVTDGSQDDGIFGVLKDLDINGFQWREYSEKFKKYHGL